jgi:hypothetical protein
MGTIGHGATGGEPVGQGVTRLDRAPAAMPEAGYLPIPSKLGRAG